MFRHQKTENDPICPETGVSLSPNDYTEDGYTDDDDDDDDDDDNNEDNDDIDDDEFFEGDPGPK